VPETAVRIRACAIVVAVLAASGEAFAQIGSSCLRPLAIADRWEEQQTAPWNLQDTFDRYDNQGQPIANPDAYRGPSDPLPTGFAPEIDQGRFFEFRLGFPGDSATVGNALGVRIGEGGGSSFVENILHCAAVPVVTGTALDAEPGNLLGPFFKSFQDLIAEDPDALWDPTANEGRGGVIQSAFIFSPRVIALPVFDPDVYALALLEGRFEIRVVRMVGFFVAGISDGVVQGYLTGWSTLTAEATTVSFGDPATLAASLQGPGAPVSGVAIEFALDGSPFGSAFTDIDGRAVLSGVELGQDVGTYQFTATLGVDSGFFSAASDAADLEVTKGLSSVNLTTSASSSIFGQAVQLTAQASADGETPSGDVTFLDGQQPIGSQTLDSSATAVVTTFALSVGSHQLSARFDGSANLATSTSNRVAHVVSAATTATSLASSVNPSRSGQSIVLTARVTPVAPGGGVPIGVVDFMRGNQLLGTVALSDGVALLRGDGHPSAPRAATGRCRAVRRAVTQAPNRPLRCFANCREMAVHEAESRAYFTLA
jgi:hypothetical protein